MPVRLVSQEELPAPLLGYKLIERLGRGGFGEVWKVEAPGGLHKAAKFVFGDLDAMDEDSRPAEQELKAMKRVREIRHPYILSLERYDQIDGQLIIIMELADRNLWDRFRECRGQGLQGVPREELLGYMAEAAEALDLMNTQYQIQHLDIKPQNLFLVHNHVKVADFGLAKVLEGVRAAVTGGVTPVYAAPETFEGWVSRFSDQYSLAIVFQELLTGNRPFNGTNTRQLLMQHMNGTPDLSGLSESDAAIIGRGLSKKPDDRYPTCGEMVRALKLSGSPLAQLIASQREPMAPAPSQLRPPGRSSSPTVAELALDPAGPNPPSSVQLTRLAPGGPGRLGEAPPQAKNNETPQPGRLPPLVQARPHGGTPLPTAGFGARLVTPSTAHPGGSNPAMTLQRPVIFQTGRMGSLGIAPPEKTGDGVLFPALVLAIGQTGKRVVEALKKLICDRYTHTDRVPNVRYLYIDTDPEAVPNNPPDHPDGLAPHEAVLARLNRPGHYLQRDSLPPVDPWMPPGALYRLPRNPAAAEGVRAFGRLALFDHYRVIAQRVRQEIEAFMIEGPVAEAHKNTRLGLRTNRPRAYIVTGLAGGTGAGMFLDVAFLLRHEMRQVGYFKPEINGVFFAPPASKANRGAALGNAYAALTELHHYQAKKGVYQTTFDKSEAPVVDSEPPFSRVAVLPLPRAVAPRSQAAAAGLAARALFNEVLTPVGRVADEGRDKLAQAVPVSGATCQTFGLFRLSWPRPEMLAAATCRFAQRQIQRWTAKDAAHLHEPIATWLAQQWTERQFDLETMAEEFRGAVQETLREDPDRVVDAIINPLRTNTPSGGKFDAVAACTVLDELLKLVGKPDAAEDGAAPGLVVAPLAARHERLVKDAEGHIGMMAATFIEVPQFRLPAAEEAVRQVTDKLKLQVDALAPVRDLLEKDVRALWTKLVTAIGALNAGRASRAAEIVELFSEYPRKRIKLHVADNCLALYRKLLGNAPEYLREINFCRGSLGEMHAQLAAAAPQSSAPVGGKLILPPGCSTLEEAADQFLAGLAPEELLTFEQGLQKEVKRKLKSVGSVCLHPNDKGPIFREILLRMSREFLDRHLDHADPAMVFFRYRSEGDAEALLAEAYEGAAPELGAKGGPGGHYETFVLGVPPGPAGDELRDLAANALPGVEVAPAALPDDICFYRELSLVPLSALPQLSEHGREAYQAMATGDHPPHARIDIHWQHAGQ
ncbi:tubulin-like doman-containing protein [Gemmata sp.]|uniref:tubulin-like doman-containing protein n=1 Tax=Gemmata sp. TaxID=1914242 RepID=UPI003F711CD4